jgi:hypothetical protein
MDLVWLGIIVTVAIALSSGLSTYLVGRRSGSGRVGTSQADDLWQQTQAMITSMQRRAERAEDQRDKLMDLQEQQTMPMLEAINQSQKHVLGLLTELAGRMDKR